LTYIVGVDGGGSKTEAVIVDTEAMEITGYGVSGPSNYHNVGMDNAVINIMDSIIRALENGMLEIDTFDSLCIALAGLDTRYDLQYFRDRLEAFNWSKKIIIEHDAHEALMAGSYGKPGISVIAGTGSIAYGWDGKNRYIAGNHGCILGDQGSGFWIGYQALQTAVKMLDGRLPKGPLADLVLKHFNVKDKEELSYFIYQIGFNVEMIASLAPIVKKAYEAGDQIAEKILVDAAFELAEAVKAVAKKLKIIGKIHVYYTGGIFNIDIVRKEFENILLRDISGVVVERLKYRPVLGALVIAAKSIGLDIQWDQLKGMDMLRVKV